MRPFALIILLVLPTIASAQQPGYRMVADFFRSLKDAIEQDDTTDLKRLVYPFKDEIEDMQAAMIENMRNGNPNQRGDGAFSMAALDTLITHHLSAIKPIPGDLYTQLATDRIFGPVISRYKQKHVWIMDFRNVHIILLENRGKLQLFFWENLNNLIHPGAP